MSLILIANNFTHDSEGNRILERPDGSADYRVGVYINDRPIFEGMVIFKDRKLGASGLLRSISDHMDCHAKKPVKGVKSA